MLLLLRQPSDALRELRMAVALGPDSSLAHHYLGTALLDSQNLDAAVTEFQEAVRLEPSASNHYYLAGCLTRLGRYDDALAELETAARLDPAQPAYRTMRQTVLKIKASTTTPVLPDFGFNERAPQDK